MENSSFLKKNIDLLSPLAIFLITNKIKTSKNNKHMKILESCIKYDLINAITFVKNKFKLTNNKINFKNNDNYIRMLTIATRHNRLEIFKFLFKTPISIKKSIKIFINSVYNIDMMMYVEKKFFLNGEGKKLSNILNIHKALYFDITEEACKLDNLKSIIYLREVNYNWNYRCFVSAIKFKNMKMLQYLRENECPYIINNNDIEKNLISVAVKANNLISVAVKANNLQAIKFLREIGPSKFNPDYKYPWNIHSNDELTIALKFAEFKNNISIIKSSEIVKYMIENNCPVTNESVEAVVKKDDLETLLYFLKESKYHYELINIFVHALINKSKTIIEYYINKDIKFDNKKFIKLLNYLINSNYKDGYFYAMKIDSILIFDYLFKNHIKVQHINPIINNSNPIYKNYLIEKKVLIFHENVNQWTFISEGKRYNIDINMLQSRSKSQSKRKSQSRNSSDSD